VNLIGLWLVIASQRLGYIAVLPAKTIVQVSRIIHDEMASLRCHCTQAVKTHNINSAEEAT